MKKYIFLPILYVVVAAKGFTQTQSGYTIFIQQDTAIQWAAECDKLVNLSPKVNAYSLKKWYLDKLKYSSVTAYHLDNDRDNVVPYKLSMPALQKQEWLKGLTAALPGYRNPKEWYFVDKTKPAGDIDGLRYRVGGLKFSVDSCCGCDEADAFRIKQVLNYKNGKFGIYTIFISPLCARQTSAVPYEWYPLCNVAYNDNPGRKFPGLSKDVVLLNTDEVDYEFSIENPFDSVLTVYRTEIGNLIYQDVLKGNLKPEEIETGKAIPAKKFLTWKMPSDTMVVYDVEDPSKITGYKVIQAERNSRDFSRIRIKQDLYFDFKNERLYSVIRSVILMLPVRFMDGTIRGYIAFCKLY